MENAKDLGPPGVDNTYGAGRLRMIAESPSAARTLENEATEGVQPGESLTVNLTAKMPLTLQGGLSVKESVPKPLKILEVMEPNSADKSSQREIEFDWPIVKPGSTKEIIYRVYVPENTDPGKYEITGSVNGNSIDSTVVTIDDNSTGRAREGLVLDEVRAITDNFFGEVEFVASGENVHEIKVKVYNLSGKEIFDSDWRERRTFQWNLLDNTGESVPNGVYLHYVTVRGPGGEIARSELNKTLVLR